MPFDIGMNMSQINSGEIKGTQIPVAVYCWFTSTGDTIPKMIKFQDPDGIIQTVTTFRIITKEKKYYCGSPSIEHLLKLEYNNRSISAKLIFELRNSTWKLVI